MEGIEREIRIEGYTPLREGVLAFLSLAVEGGVLFPVATLWHDHPETGVVTSEFEFVMAITGEDFPREMISLAAAVNAALSVENLELLLAPYFTLYIEGLLEQEITLELKCGGAVRAERIEPDEADIKPFLKEEV